MAASTSHSLFIFSRSGSRRAHIHSQLRTCKPAFIAPPFFLIIVLVLMLVIKTDKASWLDYEGSDGARAYPTLFSRPD